MHLVYFQEVHHARPTLNPCGRDYFPRHRRSQHLVLNEPRHGPDIRLALVLRLRGPRSLSRRGHDTLHIHLQRSRPPAPCCYRNYLHHRQHVLHPLYLRFLKAADQQPHNQGDYRPKLPKGIGNAPTGLRESEETRLQPDRDCAPEAHPAYPYPSAGL